MNEMKPKLLHLVECDSTNLYAKHNPAQLMPFGAVYTDNQTAGRGRLGRGWTNAVGQGLYYTVLLGGGLKQPETLPQLSSLAVAQALRELYGVECAIKWPNDLLVNGKKICGILCESTEINGERVWISGIGINLAQPQQYFDALQLPHGTSLLLQGVPAEKLQDKDALAAAVTEVFGRYLQAYAEQGFASLRADYLKNCVNLGRRVTYPLPGGAAGSGIAMDVDEDGRLVVQADDGGEKIVFTGEVSVKGIYGAV